MIDISWFLTLSAVLFALGLIIAITKKNLVVMLMGIELMLNAANINFVAFAQHQPEKTTGHLTTLFIMVIAAAEVAIALAIVLKIREKYGTVDPDQIDDLKY